MKKIIISIFIVGCLLNIVLVNVNGKETIEKTVDVGVPITQISGDDSSNVKDNSLTILTEKTDFLEAISHPLNNDSLQLPYYVHGELIVRFQEDVKINLQSAKGTLLTGLSTIDNLNSKYGGLESAEQVFKNGLDSSLSNVYRFSFSSNVDVSSLIRDYNRESNVVYVEPNYIYTTSYAQPKITGKFPNDPDFIFYQWALHNIGQTGGTIDADIDAPEAWDIETGNPDVVIAIIDTGVDYNHPDLAANIWHDPINGNPGYDFVDINTTLYDEYGFTRFPDEDYTLPDADPMDVFGHGTHCAGIASAVTNNSIGIAGVCWNCKIMPVRNGFKINYYGITYVMMEYDDSARAIVYAADNGSDVISMSWGGYHASSLIRDAVDYAYGKGVVLVASAGNDNTDFKFYPAGYDNVIGVAATDSNDHRAGFSNFGSWVDVAAPGVDILSTIPNGIYYDFFSGTSMACPHVAGLAALVLSKNYECPCPAQMVKSMIPFTTDKIDTDQYIGTGRINAYKALVQKPFAATLDFIKNWEDIKGTTDIKGAAWGEDFQYFALDIGQGKNPTSWTELLNSSTQKVGVLLSLDTKELEETLYTIRLKVVYNYKVFTKEIQIYVNNEADGGISANIYVSNCFNSTNCGSEWNKTKFNSIQDGIDKAKIGDTIFVFDGLYNEDIEIKGLLKSSISLIGQNNNWTIIDGNGKINISRTLYLKLSGFNIRKEAVLFLSSKCTISQNRLMMTSDLNYYACIALFASPRNFICGNIMQELSCSERIGVVLYASSHNTIADNAIANFDCGFYLALANSNTILNNTINGNIGIDIEGTCINNIIQNNSIKCAEGIKLFYAYGNTFIKNHIDGIIRFDGHSSLNKIIANEINGGAVILLYDYSCELNQLYYNNFNNSTCYDYGTGSSSNIWYKKRFLGGKGNYYSDYEEKYPNAANNDGIWDEPYGINNYVGYSPIAYDKYPVVEPFDIENINVNSEMTVKLTIEESQYLTQLEETINNQILAGEYNLANLEMFTESTTYGSQPSTQPSSPTK
ncbi:MAG: S8 family serine peptidase [Euryarchaeota archaeon]|nr:S8 family serine peptidase [Euryarchaeota archaeon]